MTKNLEEGDFLVKKMRQDWDCRLDLDPDFWMAEWMESHEQLLESGRRDFLSVIGDLTPGESKKWRALEYGCGTGRLTVAAAPYFASLRGLDISEFAIQVARERLKPFENVRVSQCNGINLEGEGDSTLDFIYSYAVLSHVDYSVFSNILCELVRVLKIGGRLHIQLYIGDSQSCPDINDTLTVRGYQIDALGESLSRLGCNLENIRDYFLPFDATYETSWKPRIVEAIRLKPVYDPDLYELAAMLRGQKLTAKETFVECSMLYDRFNHLIRKGDLREALKTGVFLLAKETRAAQLEELRKAIGLLTPTR